MANRMLTTKEWEQRISEAINRHFNFNESGNLVDDDGEEVRFSIEGIVDEDGKTKVFVDDTGA